MKSSTLSKKVFYEVNEHPDLPAGVQQYVYQSESLSGIAPSFDFMIERIRSKAAFQDKELELIHVESLVPLNHPPKLSEVNHISNGQKNTMSTYNIKRLLDMHQQCGIPVGLSVPFIFKALKINIGAFAESSAYARSYLYRVLNGTHSASDEFRAAMTKKLGIDPWLYAPTEEPVVIHKQIIPAESACTVRQS